MSYHADDYLHEQETSNKSKVSQFEIRVGSVDHANAIVQYCAKMDEGKAVTRDNPDSFGWWVIDLTCTARQHTVLLAFLDGLEW